MAIVHEKLYQLKNVARIAFGDYIRTLTDHLLLSYGIDPKAVRTEVSCDGSELNVDTAIACGLIVNELVSNSLKHAFNKKNGGIVSVDMHQLLDSEFQLTISDNGIGLPLDYNLLDKNTLGLNLVRNLVEQLGGDLEISGRGGTSFSIKFKEYRECGIELH